jgi:hypothetical protein
MTAVTGRPAHRMYRSMHRMIAEKARFSNPPAVAALSVAEHRAS